MLNKKELYSFASDEDRIAVEDQIYDRLKWLINKTNVKQGFIASSLAVNQAYISFCLNKKWPQVSSAMIWMIGYRLRVTLPKPSFDLIRFSKEEIYDKLVDHRHTLGQLLNMYHDEVIAHKPINLVELAGESAPAEPKTLEPIVVEKHVNGQTQFKWNEAIDKVQKEPKKEQPEYKPEVTEMTNREMLELIDQKLNILNKRIKAIHAQLGSLRIVIDNTKEF